MNHRKITVPIILSLAIWLVQTITVTAAQVTSAPWARRVDPVVLTGNQFEEVIGVDLEAVSLWACNPKGEPHPIAFQADERFESGDYMFVANKLPGTGKLSKQDELVFMARDAGYRLDQTKFPYSSRFIKEIELRVAHKQNNSWVYLVVTTLPPMRLTTEYVSFNPVMKSVVGKDYYLSYNDAQPVGVPWQANHLSLAAYPNQAQPSSKFFTPNLLKRNFMEVKYGAMGNTLRWKLAISSLQAKDLGQKSGPIRTIRKFRLRPSIGFGIDTNPVDLTQTYYDTFVSTKVEGDVKVLGSRFLSKVNVRMGQEFGQSGEVAGNLLSYQVDREVLNVFTPNEHQLVALDLSGNSVEGVGIRTSTYFEIQGKENSQDAFAFPPSSESCAQCFEIEVDAKRLAGKPLDLELLQYFPGGSERALLEPFLAMHRDPIEVRASTISQGIVLRSIR